MLCEHCKKCELAEGSNWCDLCRRESSKSAPFKAGPRPPPVTLSIINIRGEVQPIDISPAARVCDLKRRIYELRRHLDCYGMRLVFVDEAKGEAHHSLDDLRTLRSYGIDRDVPVYLLMSLRTRSCVW